MANPEFQLGDLALAHRVGLEPGQRNGPEEVRSEQNTTTADDEVQAAQLQSLFDAEDVNSG